MIWSYGDKKTEAFARGEVVRDFEGFTNQAIKRLAILEAATSLNDLQMLRGNRLESLSGDRDRQYSIRINRQWRVCFEWPRNARGPTRVEIVEYHR